MVCELKFSGGDFNRFIKMIQPVSSKNGGTPVCVCRHGLFAEYPGEGLVFLRNKGEAPESFPFWQTTVHQLKKLKPRQDTLVNVTDCGIFAGPEFVPVWPGKAESNFTDWCRKQIDEFASHRFPDFFSGFDRDDFAGALTKVRPDFKNHTDKWVSRGRCTDRLSLVNFGDALGFESLAFGAAAVKALRLIPKFTGGDFYSGCEGSEERYQVMINGRLFSVLERLPEDDVPFSCTDEAMWFGRDVAVGIPYFNLNYHKSRRYNFRNTRKWSVSEPPENPAVAFRFPDGGREFRRLADSLNPGPDQVFRLTSNGADRILRLRLMNTGKVWHIPYEEVSVNQVMYLEERVEFTDETRTETRRVRLPGRPVAPAGSFDAAVRRKFLTYMLEAVEDYTVALSERDGGLIYFQDSRTNCAAVLERAAGRLGGV
jgi:hypothetical protein